MGEDNSGKTVLLRMITGDLEPSLGTAVIDDIDLKEDSAKYLTKLAYCPEQNALLGYLTGFQMVQLMGRLRGLPHEYLDIHAKQWLLLLGINRDVFVHSSSISLKWKIIHNTFKLTSI
jgi:ABC-type multidrug transport system ATPase subunit